MPNILYLTTASVLALGLACAGPALAETGASPNRGTTPSSMRGQSLDRSQIEFTLRKAGVADRQNLPGHLVWADDPSGQAVAFLIGPENMQAGHSARRFDKDKLRSDLSKAGFKSINFADNPEMVRGQTSAGHQVLAFESQSGAKPATAYVDASKLDNELNEAGLQDSRQLNGKLLRTQGAGRLLFVLVAPKDFRNAAPLKFTDGQIDNFLRDGFIDASMYNNNIAMVQGRLNNRDVIAVVGANIGPTGPSA